MNLAGLNQVANKMVEPGKGIPATRCHDTRPRPEEARRRTVAEAFQKANDDAHYKEWKRTEESDCKTIGFPF